MFTVSPAGTYWYLSAVPELRGRGHDVARCTVERLMRDNGWEGAAYGSKHRTTIPDPTHVRFPDLVDRNFSPATPNRLWVADVERHEALSNRVGVGDLHRRGDAAAWL